MKTLVERALQSFCIFDKETPSKKPEEEINIEAKDISL